MRRVAIFTFNRAAARLRFSAATAIAALLPAVASLIASPALARDPPHRMRRDRYHRRRRPPGRPAQTSLKQPTTNGKSHDPLLFSSDAEPGENRTLPGRGGPALRSHPDRHQQGRSEEHTSELQSLMRISYAAFCLKKKITTN